MYKYIKNRLLSFKWAITGMRKLFSNHANAQIHLLASIIVVLLAVYFRITVLESCILVLCIGLVLSMEALNSAIEILSDRVSSKQDNMIEHVKDIAAAAVLLSAICAAIVGGIIFLPKVYALFF
ncbi:MAG: diacylglycerol kinase family protein [Saprospiraceae bacterium]|nr:diacylglycerol kinase family protein [Saprospiraceae bacterium]